MNTINWNDLAQQATLQTDKEFNQQLAILTNLTLLKLTI